MSNNTTAKVALVAILLISIVAMCADARLENISNNPSEITPEYWLE